MIRVDMKLETEDESTLVLEPACCKKCNSARVKACSYTTDHDVIIYVCADCFYSWDVLLESVSCERCGMPVHASVSDDFGSVVIREKTCCHKEPETVQCSNCSELIMFDRNNVRMNKLYGQNLIANMGHCKICDHLIMLDLKGEYNQRCVACNSDKIDHFDMDMNCTGGKIECLDCGHVELLERYNNQLIQVEPDFN